MAEALHRTSIRRPGNPRRESARLLQDLHRWGFFAGAGSTAASRTLTGWSDELPAVGTRMHRGGVLRHARVERVTPLTTGLQRITFTGRDLPALRYAGPDQRCKLFLPGRLMRTYTIRDFRPDERAIDIDFVRHGRGPASRWAEAARVGEQVAICSAQAEFAPPAGTDWVLIVGDGSALPAVNSIVEHVGRRLPLRAFLTLDGEPGDWPLPAGEVNVCGDPLAMLVALSSAALPAGRPYIWVAGESGTVLATRTHLLRERHYSPEAASFMCYWRRDRPLAG